MEEPILKGLYGNVTVDRIDVACPPIKLAEEFACQIWPVHQSFLWTKEYNDVTICPPCWRRLKLHSLPNHLALLQNARRGTGISMSSNLEISAAEVRLKILLKVNARVEIAQVPKSTGNITTTVFTKYVKQIKIIKASDMVKTKTLIANPSKTQKTANLKKLTKSKKANKSRKAAKTKKKVKKAVKKDITAALANTVGRQLRLKLKKALQSSLISTRNLCLIVAIEQSLKKVIGGN